MTIQMELQHLGIVVIVSQLCLNYFFLFILRYTFNIETKIATYINLSQFISTIKAEFHQDIKMHGKKCFINGSNGVIKFLDFR